MSSDETQQSAKDARLRGRINKYLHSEDLSKLFDRNQYMKPWFASAELVVASAAKDGTGRTVWRFPVLKDYLQHFQTLAGGAQSAMHGTCTSWTLFTIAKPDWWSALGSSRTLNMSFFKAAKESDVLRLQSEIVNIGTRMAMIQGVLLRESDGQIISTSEHHMVRAGPPGAKM